MWSEDPIDKESDERSARERRKTHDGQQPRRGLGRLAEGHELEADTSALVPANMIGRLLTHAEQAS